MKPAEQTPLTALRVGELAIEAGFPAGVINLINGFGETAGDAMSRPSRDRQDRIHGACRYGAHHHEACSGVAQADDVRARRQEPEHRVRRCGPGRSRQGSFHAIYFHGGQCCTAGSRIFVENTIKTSS
jgi:hypothetical protein